MPTTTPDAVSLELAELHRHLHGKRCWWNHLEARWNCATTAPTT